MAYDCPLSTSACVEHEYLNFFYKHWASHLTHFLFLRYLPYQILTISPKSIIFKIFVVSIIHYSRLKFLKKCLHNSKCHLVKVRQTCFDYTRLLKTSRFVSQNKVNARRFVGVLIAGWLFNKVFQVISIAEDWSTNICLRIKISYNNEVFIVWWI